MNPAQISRRLDRIEADPSASSQVVIVHGTYAYQETTNDDGGVMGQSVAEAPDRVRLILESGRQFLIERGGESIDAIAEKVAKAYPFGSKILVFSDSLILRT